MAQTESRTGFRLPWSSDDRTAENQPHELADDLRAVSPSTPDDAIPGTTGTPGANGSDPGANAHAPAAPTPEASVMAVPHPVGPASTTAVPRRPTKFLAELTKAMHGAAEVSKAATLEQFGTDAKTYVERVRARSAEAATALRKRSEEDVAEIRDWSKAEIARIREETERRTVDRRASLERELAEHAAMVEQQVAFVERRIGRFEAEMSSFFERLLQEEDPTEFAAMAQNLPEAPSFEALEDLEDDAWLDELTAPVSPPSAAVRADSQGEAGSDPADDPARPGHAAGPNEPTNDVASNVAIEPTPDSPDEPAAARVEAPAAAAAIQGLDSSPAAFGLPADFAAAEAEAEAAAEASTYDELPEIGSEALAARLAGDTTTGALASPPAGTPADTPATSQVIVVGLISVASIASFKRQLSRVPGVESVGVSSGPNGEFVFSVVHGTAVGLADVIPNLAGFTSTVTEDTEGTVRVEARDEEAEA